MPLIESLEKRMLMSSAGTGSSTGQVFELVTFLSPPTPLAFWKVYVDLNHDGHLSPRDPVAVADSVGDYTFSNLRVGRYRVAAVFPPGWVPALGGKGWTPATVQAGQTTTGVNIAAVAALANASASLVAPRRTSFRPGSVGLVTLRLSNAADSSPISGRFDITLVASTSSSIEGGTTLAGTVRAIRVPGNAARNIPLTFLIPRTLPAGTYMLFATILPHGAPSAFTITTPASAPIIVTNPGR